MSALLAFAATVPHKSGMIIGYIDPGTGSMVFQVLAAAILSAGLFFRGLRTAIVGALAHVLRIKSKSSEPDTAGVESASSAACESELRKAA